MDRLCSYHFLNFPKNINMGKGKPRGFKRRNKSSSEASLNKKQKQNIKDFGESEPDIFNETGREKYHKVNDDEEDDFDQQGGSVTSEAESESEGEELTVYQKLLQDIESGKKKSKKERRTEGKNVSIEVTNIIDSEDELMGAEIEDKQSKEDEDPGKDSELGDQENVDSDEEETKVENSTAYSDEEGDDEDEDEIQKSDPFVVHLENTSNPETFEDRMPNLNSWMKKEIQVQEIGKCDFFSPSTDNVLPKTVGKGVQLQHVKKTLCNQLIETNKKFSKATLKKGEMLNPFQMGMFSIINGYKDLYYPQRNHHNGEQIRLVYCLHALNHVLKTRSRVIAHNTKLKSKDSSNGQTDVEYRDQGFTRPKVLMVVPFRDSALRIVNILSNLLMPKEQSFVSNKKRFRNEFKDTQTVEKKGFKPEDYEETFVGNTDDHFRIGLGISKKSLKLYTDFYASDIIIASPLGLRTIIGAEGEEKDFDFLSSIEVLIFDQADVCLMQNWEHVWYLMDYMHKTPSQNRGIDFDRVRGWCLNELGKYFRQTLVFSAIVAPEISNLFNKHCQNYAGKIKVPYEFGTGTLSMVVTTLPQVFHRIKAESHKDLIQKRFQYFTENILPQFTENASQEQTFIFIPSYFDYVTLRNYFLKKEIKFAKMNEYSKDKTISRNRSFFFHGRLKFMLYTERFHFYRRYKIRGIKHLIFFELPHYPHFYSEICNMLHDPMRNNRADNYTCTVLFGKHDAHKLACVTGFERACRMINSEKDIHMLVTGE